MKAKELLKAALPAAVRKKLRYRWPRPGVRRLRSLESLDAELEQVRRAFEVSEDAGRRAFASFSLVPLEGLPRDPECAAYREAQLALYLRISGRERYHVDNEHSPFEVDAAVRDPFPYGTHSPTVVGDQLVAQGRLVRALPVPPPASLLEFGPGWGNTTLHFVQMGYAVTAVEIDPKFCELLRRRCAAHAERLEVVQGDMLAFRSGARFDAVVFFESFHHCPDPVQLLRNCRGLLNVGGSIVFAGEPITDFPYPWGVRLDGESLWAMRRYGWLELGFDRRYFLGLLEREGFSVRPAGVDVFVATLRSSS